MKKIKLLNNNMINQIAAGEVVERPSSVVKELVENAIDALATIITIEIKEGGVSLIRVSDNGIGISEEDIKSVFLKHATSKIEDINDLESVLTLGFRGEAMSSIASVSQLEMLTKEASFSVGTYIEIHGGKILKQESVGLADGTSVIVRNLFYNVPARRKFLKKPAAESGYISDIIQKFALSHPQICFKYILNGKKILQTSGNGDLKTAIFHVYGKEVSTSLLDVDTNTNNIFLKGHMGKPQLNRSNRNYCNFFVNGRFVKNKVLQSAVEEAFKTKLPIGKFPVYVLNLTIPPTCVDVNVHPTKLEIKFSNEEEVYNFIFESIQNILQSNTLIPKYTNSKPLNNNTLKDEVYIAQEPKEGIPTLVEEIEQNNVKQSPVNNSTAREVFSSVLNTPEETKHSYVSEKVKQAHTNEIKNNIKEEKVKHTFFKNYKIIGQILSTYWLIEQNTSIYLIDQHAAHERVLYEGLMDMYKNGSVVSQRLLQPQAVKLSLTEREVFYNNKGTFKKMGFEIEEFGEDSFAIRSVPFIFKEGIEPLTFIELIDKLSVRSTPLKTMYDTKLEVLSSFACKAAVKANDTLSYTEAKALIEKMLMLENPFTCPHGRPTIVEITKYEIEKMFKRIQ